MSVRGPEPVVTIDGKPYRLRLTLGALAAIEDAFGGDLSELAGRLSKPRVADIVFLVHALIGGGGAAIAVEALKASDLDLAEAARAVASAFSVLGEGGGR